MRRWKVKVPRFHSSMYVLIYVYNFIVKKLKYGATSKYLGKKDFFIKMSVLIIISIMYYGSL